MKNSLPWFPFYTYDWSSDTKVRMMGPVARAYYVELLRTQWEEGSIPAEIKDLQRLLEMPHDPGMANLDRETIIRQVLSCFIPGGPGRLINPKLQRVREEQERIAGRKKQASQIANDKRWNRSERNPFGVQSDSVRSPTAIRLRSVCDPNIDIDKELNTNTDTDSKADPVQIVEIRRQLQKIAEKKSLNA